MKKTEKSIAEFCRDTIGLGGYQYTTNEKVSSRIANDYITHNTLRLVSMKNKTIIDVGCGDGVYTYDVYKHGKPAKIYAFDAASDAIKQAQTKLEKQKIKFCVGNVYSFPTEDIYDIAIVRGVLHHLYRPQDAISEIVKHAKTVIIIEPNGYNPILKIIEKVSPYHRKHEEKSYFPFTLKKWIGHNEGKIKTEKYKGFVPFFCPDLIAKLLKKIEPIIEGTPLINRLLCANYYVVFSTPLIHQSN